ncbi:TetR/AcrR family transcriptional regulator [Planococcus shenhongbingii]|uniref:TetR/AcrR family transcriptional regulator n=1 Tax=Planococcus shenhongbingii TaxID=3058398 RepID=A0ABT8NFQ6_9BACL|nr:MULTISPECIES: TetR/AcrR family transcriptional regulator [unclassified Planococcus (in: firmicutes)]MDN7246730.1 TetR/AcrR family transcriptional regulator [Planococcus sp. N017]WKA58909.1 TetR/AcrR family transcriptional regulator [Planococcus sp. N016]
MKAKIKQQSILLFEQKGFSETSIQDIVDVLGVTKGTFYYYFPSKEQLLMDIHSNYIDDLLRRQEAIQETEMYNREKLQAIVELLIGDIQDHGPSARVFFREMRHLASENAEKVKKKREQFRLNIEKLISQGIEEGEFRNEMPPDIVAFAILGVTNWSYQWFNPNGEISAERLAAIYSDLILNGIT